MLEITRRAWTPALDGAPWDDEIARQKELARAVALFVESFAFLQKIGSPSPIGIVSGLAGFAALALGQGQFGRAAQLYGAAEAVRAAADVGLAPIACAECERNIATLRRRLDDITFARAWAEGRAMTYEAAVAYALEAGLYSGEALPWLAAVAAEPVETLTPRELEILRLIAEGLSNREIACAIIMSVGTIKWYTGQIYSKLQVRGRTQAIARARAVGLLP